MYFLDVEIENYKGYRKSTRLHLKKGINIIVGKNNAGKTALLETLSLDFAANPHRSILTLPTPASHLNNLSIATITFSLTKDELLNFLLETHENKEKEFSLPLPAENDPSQKYFRSQVNEEQTEGFKALHAAYDETKFHGFGEWFFSHETFTFRVVIEAYSSRRDSANWLTPDGAYISPRFERDLKNDGLVQGYLKFKIDPANRDIIFNSNTQSSGSQKYRDDFITAVGRRLVRRAYRFEAERFPAAPCQLGTNQVLEPDARNLAEVLHLLQQNFNQFGEFNKLVQEVLPEICQVNSHKLGNEKNEGEVLIWTDKAATARNDLAFGLEECGSGYGQVLAILYVLLTAKEPQVIIIDEPQSFLHPGAARKLIEILHLYGKAHQIIIATHSPTAITAAEPDTITLIRQSNSESNFESIDVEQFEQQRIYLADVGVRPSDVFGYDKILWVEGETEEKCFPLILQKESIQLKRGMIILKVQHTGDFEGKHADKVIAIYQRLSQAQGGIFPDNIGYVFDRELHTPEKLTDLKRLKPNHIHFIERRMYENYLLNPNAIAAIANAVEGFSKSALTKHKVAKWIEKNRRESKYYKPLKFPGEANWKMKIDGAVLLSDLFSDLSETRVKFDKVQHSLALTKWLLENSVEDLHEISNLLADILDENSNR